MLSSRFGSGGWVVVVTLAVVPACRQEYRHAGKPLGVLSTCSSDCNGALPTFACAELDPGRFVSGTAWCDATCTARYDTCLEHAATACDPLAVNICGAARICVRTGADPTEGQCVDDPGVSTSCGPPGVTRCDGARLEQCAGGTWQLARECSDDGGTCIPNLSGPGHTCTTVVGGCTTGMTRCSGNSLEVCDGDGFVFSEDCGVAGNVCATSARGAPACVAPATDCDFSNIGPAEVRATVFDVAAAAYYKEAASFVALTLENDFAEVRVELFGDRGAPTASTSLPLTIPLTGAETDYSTCRVCVVATRRSSGVDRTFMPIGGAVQLHALPSTVGDAMSLSFRDLALREVTIDPVTWRTREVTAGASWCFSDTTLSEAATGFGCDAEGSGACVNGSEMALCRSGTLERESCTTGTVCREGPGGTASCGTPLEPSECDIEGHSPWLTSAYFDTDAWRYPTASGRGFYDDLVFVESFPEQGGPTAPGTVSITGPDSDRHTCSTCVWAGVGMASFVARSGTIEIVEMPDAMGDAFVVTLRDIEMHQVDPDRYDIPGGLTWCIPEVTLGTATQRYPCFGAYYGNRTCAGDRLLSCDLGNTWQLERDCSAQGSACVVTGSGTATCQ